MNWIDSTVGEYCPFVYGKGLPKTKRQVGEHPVYGSNGCVDYHNDFFIDGPGLIIGRKGSVGAVHLSEVPFWPIDTAFYVKKETLGELRFTFYLLRSLGLEKMNSDSAVPGLNRDNAHALLIRIPATESEREALGNKLALLDQKIGLNNKTNQTLEEMAQAIFKSWFVDFDPVKAKMNGEEPEGMDAATASLFPEKLVESELGLIPEGWDVGTLDSHTSMIIDHRGKTPKKLGSDWVEQGYPAISAKNIKSKKIVRPDTIRFLDETTYKKWMKEPLVKGDIIMTSEAPMGELYFFDGSQDFCLSQRLYGLRANSDVCNPVFLFDWLQTIQAKADMEGRASGSTVLGIKQAELRKVKILTPPKDILDKYSSIVSNLIDMTAKNNAQNISLEKLRDTLLPKLLSGEIELAEIIVME
ncbi:restriction endonuclease subunit S [Vibrio sp. B1Z05]|uniref:restriction endonuclease subunit S n=1 Tax=Vibrio sp. B1Z05 TaxID=2654980 RepID=UPI00128C6942|nr:restriction endonuclease subunit S [Vibrio sp. B1Z05]MPW37309.1 restriction endonuclease subunit S [Vibrio sp. B1Z05]